MTRMSFTNLGDEYLISETPWPLIEDRNRPWYVPYMLQPFVRDTMFKNLVPYAVRMDQVKATEAYFTQRIGVRENIEEVDFRGVTLPREYFDSQKFSVGFKAYGSSVQYHKWDAMIFQWAERAAKNPELLNVGIPQPDLAGILQSDLARAMSLTMDTLARNQFLRNEQKRSFAGDATGFHDLASTDVFDPDIARGLQLMLGEADFNPAGTVPALTSPAALYQATGLTTDTGGNYVNFRQSVGDSSLLNYVVGDWMGVTWMRNKRMILPNVGAVLASASIVTPVYPGDGAPAHTTKVDGQWQVGHEDATHYIQLSSISDPGSAETGFKLHDKVTLTRRLASANAAMATAGAAVWDEPSNITLEVVEIDYDNDRIALREPILNERFATAIVSGLYGYVVKARPVHACIFFHRGVGENGLANVVMNSPEFYIVPPADARRAVWTFSWDAYMGYAHLDPTATSIHFYAGAIERNGKPLVL